MKKIEKLTESQEKDLVTYRNQCLVAGRSVTPINHSEAERIITKFYARLGKSAPTFHYFSSPRACLLAYKKMTKCSEGDMVSQLNNAQGGQQWFYWQALYKFAEKVGVNYTAANTELLNEWVDEANNLHTWFPYETGVLISERPIRLTVNETGQLHNESQMAIEYSDGYGIYYLNGVSVPEYLVTTASENLSMDFFTKEENADVKAEFVRKFGVERMLQIGKKVDTFEEYDQETNPWWWKSEYELWDMAIAFPGIEYQPYLKMRNQTTDIWHVEAVSPSCRDIGAALKERFGGRDFEIQSIV